MLQAFQSFFVFAYFLGFAFFVFLILRFRARRPDVEQRTGRLPAPPALISWLVPPLILLVRIGDISSIWLPVRVVGIGFGLYALVLLPWAAAALGASYAPGPALLRGQALVTTGPYQWIRHPIYSAVVTLWLGAALGTLNWLLLLLWPGMLVGVRKQAQTEEKLLRGHFGDRYDEYAATTGSLFPRPTRLGRGAI